jgi:hypothetical protein
MNSTRRQCITLIAAIALGLATGANAAKPAPPPVESISLAPGAWVIMTYVPDNGYTVPIPFSVQKARDGSVKFDFLDTPDRAMLLTHLKQAIAKGSLGKTISAHVAIQTTPGAEFNYCGPVDCAGSDAGGFVRLYLEGANPALSGCLPDFDPSRPDCEAQYWWSNPIAIDLDALAALGPNGIVLQVPLNVDNWSDRDGHLASDTSPLNYPVAFAASVAHANKLGLSFGGGDNFAFGAGATDPAEATFYLLKLEIK